MKRMEKGKKHKTNVDGMVRCIILCLSNCFSKKRNRIYNVSEIANITNLDRTAIPKYLDFLVALGVVDEFIVVKRRYYGLDNYIYKKMIDKGGEYIKMFSDEQHTILARDKR